MSRCVLVVPDDSFHHTCSLDRRKVTFYGGRLVREGFLLQKLAFDDFGVFEDEFLVLGRRFVTKQLHNLVQLHPLMRNIFYPLPEGIKTPCQTSS